ncbi:ABC transporter permease [Intrasporangium oryzae NRRL B-24470]|uniref:ABC transporter permease n=1 Tax=Intrasporangium oryzae NRRL B-24470 TaxID=1386089 RepID=W9G4Y8_9MICO|nr:ABC transporter permease subunit [Intrasporangium oryzae]EWT01060.1 ABC transporter permease [Intrasporangium oryzae NRRL B-24470]
MFGDVLVKTLRDQKRSLLGWVVAIVLVVLMYAAIWPSIRDQPSLNDFLDQMPEAFRSLFATSGADMSTPAGYLQIELMSFMGPILVLLYTVTQGTGAVAGEEDRHTLDLLLTNPVSRTQVVLEKAAALVVGTVLIAAVTGVSLLFFGRLFDMSLPPGMVAAAMLHLALLGLVFGSMALAIGAVTGRPALARGIPAFVAVVAYLVNGLGPMVSWLEPLQRYSPFYQYVAHDPLRHGVSWPSVLVAVATVVVLLAVAVWGFRRRDVRG